MKICVSCVGKLREKWQKLACDEYIKRLGRFCDIEIREFDDEPEPDKPSPALDKRVIDREAQRILSAVKPDDCLVGLYVNAKAPDSVGFAKMLASWRDGSRRIVFAIGGSLGLGDEVARRCDEKISFSNLTFPHQLMRVILLEQLYRACKINAGERYHK